MLYSFKGSSIRVLLVHNGKTWSIPKGSVKRSETKRKAAKRELKEETGLASPKKIIELGYVQKRNKTERLHCFMGEYSDKKSPKPYREIKKTKFVAVTSAAGLVEKFQVPLLHWLLTVSNSKTKSAKV